MRKDKEHLSISIPFPPSVNHYWGVHGHRRFIKKQGVAFREQVAEICKDLPSLIGKMWIRLIVHPPDNRKRDLDNLLKATLDALEKAGLYRDDNLFDDIHIVRAVKKDKGEVRIYIGEIDE